MYSDRLYITKHVTRRVLAPQSDIRINSAAVNKTKPNLVRFLDKFYRVLAN